MLDVSPEECKKRVFDRKDHPTIKDRSEEAFHIIDRFLETLVKPLPIEGFSSIQSVASQEEIDVAIDTFSGKKWK